MPCIDDLQKSADTVRIFRDKENGKIVAIETQNGHIERYACKEMTNAQSNAFYGLDIVQRLTK